LDDIEALFGIIDWVNETFMLVSPDDHVEEGVDKVLWQICSSGMDGTTLISLRAILILMDSEEIEPIVHSFPGSPKFNFALTERIK
jgi:hypothetical protein